MDRRFKKECAEILTKVINTPLKTLLEDVKQDDYKDKKDLIDQIDMFKDIYRKTGIETAKEIVDKLTEELEEVNDRIERIKNYGTLY